MTEHDIIIDADGAIRFIYSDDVAEIFSDDEQTTTRASHVEPAESFGWEQNGWLADMRPSGGSLLHAAAIDGVKQAFKTRQQALDAELAWLRQHKGL